LPVVTVDLARAHFKGPVVVAVPRDLMVPEATAEMGAPPMVVVAVAARETVL
jgi:hypothetical protein